MEMLAGSLAPDELNRVGFRLYERFRPEVSAGAKGWGAKGVLELALPHFHGHCYAADAAVWNVAAFCSGVR